MTLDDNILVNNGGFEANSLCKIITLSEYNGDHDNLKVIYIHIYIYIYIYIYIHTHTIY